MTGPHLHWGIKIPLRDGVCLEAVLYLPEKHSEPGPVIFGLTPYIAQVYHERGVYFANSGYPFMAVNVRGRGGSEGVFKPYAQEAADGHDIVEWLARQPYCNGQVAMTGGSYGGLDQWNTARECPPHLATIVPVASPYMAVDFPLRSNIASPYWMQWLTLVQGQAAQDKIFGDKDYWLQQCRKWFESGAAFRTLDTALGNPSRIFQEWVEHPHCGPYWDAYNPTAEQYARMSLPILTITGMYDADQLGALTHYREHMKHASEESRQKHYLVIGPWDHAGTAVPKAAFGGLTVGAASLIDLKKLHCDWYAWTLQGAARPDFLKARVTYYMTGAEEWRYADSLDDMTGESQSLFLDSTTNPTDLYHSGGLSAAMPRDSEPDHYIYDPRDVSRAELESQIDPESLVDQRLLHADAGRHLIYHSAPFSEDTELTGFMKLRAWLAIDQPDTDFVASVHEIALDGRSLLLGMDWIRARYRESSYEETLIATEQPLRYDFERFPWISRRVRKEHRLRLVIGPSVSIYSERNFNAGGVVAEETLADARTVTVRLFHDGAHPSALVLPIAKGGRAS